MDKDFLKQRKDETKEEYKKRLQGFMLKSIELINVLEDLYKTFLLLDYEHNNAVFKKYIKDGKEEPKLIKNYLFYYKEFKKNFKNLVKRI